MTRPAGSHLRPGRERRRPLVPPRRLHPQARPRSDWRTPRARAETHDVHRPRTCPWPAVLPVKEGAVPMPSAPTLEKSQSLKLDAMAHAWTEQQHAETSLGFDERFGLLVETEWLARA